MSESQNETGGVEIYSEISTEIRSSTIPRSDFYATLTDILLTVLSGNIEFYVVCVNIMI